VSVRPPHLGLIVALFVLAHAEKALAASRGRFAVIIGDNGGTTEEPPLRHAEHDAARLAEVMQKLGDVPPENVVLMLGRPGREIIRSLMEVNVRLRDFAELGEETALLVYYSGHADARGLHPGPSTLAYDELKALIRGSPAKVRILVIDACRSGALTTVKGARPAPSFEINVDADAGVEGLAMITSSAAGEDSHESERLGGSFFSHHFTNALLGAGDKDGDGRITLTEAYEYAYHQTLRSSGYTISLQHPTYAFELKGRGDFVLTRLDEANTQNVRIRLADPGLYLVIEREEGGPVRAEVMGERKGMLITVPPGEYLVQQRKEERMREYQIVARAGEEIDLEKLAHRDVAYAPLIRKGGSDLAYANTAFVAFIASPAVLGGLGPVEGAMVAYDADFEWASLSARVRWGRATASAQPDRLGTSVDELGLAVAGERFVDLSWISLGGGLLIEAAYARQAFATYGSAPPRSSFIGGIGALFTAEREVWGPLVARIEAGPITRVFPRATTDTGAAISHYLETRLTVFADAGLGWRF
jgi:hypothetical protein